MQRRLHFFDFTLLACALLLVGLGSLAIFSASAGGLAFRKQLVFVTVSLAAMTVLALTNFELFDRLAPWIYAGTLALLVAVFVGGAHVRGAQRWLNLGGFQLQPSEFAKLFLTLALASLLAKHQAQITEPLTLLKAFALMGLPALIVFKQPHLGNTLALFAILFGMLFVAGARVSHLALTATLGLLIFAVAWKTDRIKPEQKRRLTAFLNSADVRHRDENWQALQSRVAIGSGGLLGQGHQRGSQNQLGFVPDNHTDFIFAVIGEEHGFVGGALVLGLLTVMLWRMLVILRDTEIVYGALVASGLFVWMAWQVFVNLGMTMQLLPVTGLPLPFVSYGGSSMLSSFMSLGVLQSIAMRRRRMTF